jgi:hypothetical protein
MKLKHLGFCLFILLVSATVAHANGMPVDPQMIVSDPFCTGTEGPCTPVLGTTFSFSSNANGGGFLRFQNLSTVDWSSLLIETGSTPSNIPANTITCITNAFMSCNVFDLAGGITAIYLSGVNPVSSNTPPFGILNNFVFTINLNDNVRGLPNTNPAGAGGWGAFRVFDASANVPSPVPEPATLTLLGVGLVALLLKKKSRQRGQHAENY